jgi:hypothetical protein
MEVVVARLLPLLDADPPDCHDALSSPSAHAALGDGPATQHVHDGVARRVAVCRCLQAIIQKMEVKILPWVRDEDICLFFCCFCSLRNSFSF